MPSRVAGRPTKLTAAVQAEVCWALAMGFTYELVAAVAGITRQTLFLWVQRGEAGDSRYANFILAFRQANARAKVTALKRIGRMADAGNWQAAAWLLEHCWPEEFARSTPANQEARRVRAMSDDELLAELAQVPGTLVSMSRTGSSGRA